MTEMISAGALEISWGLRRDLVWFKALLNCQPWRIVNLASKRRQLVVVIDASWDSFAWQRGGAQMSWWIFAEGRAAFGEVCFVPPKFLHRCRLGSLTLRWQNFWRRWSLSFVIFHSWWALS